nr:PREDICTED: sorting nexin-16-like [Lepisosteus oculatus]
MLEGMSEENMEKGSRVRGLQEELQATVIHASWCSLSLYEAYHLPDHKLFAKYKIFVTNNRDSWFVIRQYKDFVKLFKMIKKQYPDAQLNQPQRKLFGRKYTADICSPTVESVGSLQALLIDSGTHSD